VSPADANRWVGCASRISNKGVRIEFRCRYVTFLKCMRRKGVWSYTMTTQRLNPRFYAISDIEESGGRTPDITGAMRGGVTEEIFIYIYI